MRRKKGRKHNRIDDILMQIWTLKMDRRMEYFQFQFFTLRLTQFERQYQAVLGNVTLSHMDHHHPMGR